VGGLAGLILLGLAVGRGSTPLDDWFHQLGDERPGLRGLLLFSDGTVVLTLWVIVVIVALVQRRWRLAAVAAVTAPAGVALARLGKQMFGRIRDGEVAYPSGHTTLATIVVVLTVLLVGVTAWTVVIAVITLALAVIGQAVSYHYFTDTIGALFLGTAVVCAAVSAATFDRCQPEGDLDHTTR
jgi:membrane-associated phospholipid phosphatase